MYCMQFMINRLEMSIVQLTQNSEYVPAQELDPLDRRRTDLALDLFFINGISMLLCAAQVSGCDRPPIGSPSRRKSHGKHTSSSNPIDYWFISKEESCYRRHIS